MAELRHPPGSGSPLEAATANRDCPADAVPPERDALRLHALYQGKVQTMPKCPIRDLRDFAVWYTPGVAEPCKAIQRHPDLVYDYTNKANSIAIVSDGSRVLGLGNIGPAAGLPVMEGKALLFKYLGGVDAVPLCLATEDPDELIRTVRLLEPSFGAVNLEDIAQPDCFRILDTLRAHMTIPVWHDDQQGTAIVTLAALLNGTQVVGKALADIRIALVGVGAANVAVYRLLKAHGIDPGQIIACDSQGILHSSRRDIADQRTRFADKWRICCETNPEHVRGGILEALRGADVCIAFSRSEPGVIQADWVAAMAPDPIVFACANPIPEIWPWEAKQRGARIVATGRSDFPNQLNNALAFPGVFRGVLDIRARTITDEMALAAADELACCAQEHGISEERILPNMDEWEIHPRVAVATAIRAQEQGVARLSKTQDELHTKARQLIQAAREAVQVLMREKLIHELPAG